MSNKSTLAFSTTGPKGGRKDVPIKIICGDIDVQKIFTVRPDAPELVRDNLTLNSVGIETKKFIENLDGCNPAPAMVVSNDSLVWGAGEYFNASIERDIELFSQLDGLSDVFLFMQGLIFLTILFSVSTPLCRFIFRGRKIFE